MLRVNMDFLGSDGMYDLVINQIKNGEVESIEPRSYKRIPPLRIRPAIQQEELLIFSDLDQTADLTMSQEIEFLTCLS